RLPVQHFLQRPARLHLRHPAADCAHLSLFPQLRRAPARPDDLRPGDVVDADGSVHPVLYHLLARDDGVLDLGNHHHRFHRLLVRIFPRRPNVPDRHHASRNASGAEMDAVLLRTVLSGRDFSRTTERRRSLASARHPNRLAFSYLVNRANDVAPRPAPLPGGRRITNYLFEGSRETTRKPWFAR